MATFKEITAADIKTSRSTLNQLIDVIQEDISGSTTRRSYQVFVTGGVGPGVTSSLFQTVYDQDFSLQTANAVMDITVGLYRSGSTVTGSETGVDSEGKILFPSHSMMMREKVDIYRQFAATLLGDADKAFYAPFSEVSATDAKTTATDRIDEALFIVFKRLFHRDQIKRETFALKMYETASIIDQSTVYTNTNLTSESGAKIYTDFGSSVNQRTTFGSDVGDLVDSSNTSRKVGNIFYDSGVVVLDLAKVISGSQKASGTIDAMSTAGTTVIGESYGNPTAKFIPDFMVSASIDDIVDHFASCRFSSGTLTGMTFQNNTFINSTLVFCRATADEFNYSSNPTFTDSEDRIRVIDQGQEGVQRSFTYPSTVGLYDANNNLLAVAKLSRPVEKSDERDLTIRLRLDF